MIDLDFRTFLDKNIVLLDGGMGTMLQAAGLGAGEHSEEWNISHPDTVTSVHKAYYDAGSNVVSTNTFGINSLKYTDAEMKELISAAVQNCINAKFLSDAPQEKFIAFDIGPLGKMLKPYGELDFNDTVEIFSKTVRIAVKTGIDLFMIETMNDSYETKAALLAVKENSDLPVIVSNAYSEDCKLVTGASPEAMAAMLVSMGVDALGVNCSFGPDKALDVVRKLLMVSSVPVILKPNAGLPEFLDNKTTYNVMPDAFAEDILSAVKAGVRVVGGCCGTTPEYILAVAKILDGLSPVLIKTDKKTVVSSYTHTVTFDDKPILIGERINPTGKKRFKQALIENDIAYILREGINQQEKGVHILDVNVGLAGIDERQMLTNVVSELQAISDLPLQLDSADPVALEKAMRIYNGKPLVNSVNGKISSMEAVFPLVKKYGGTVIALTLDENGIPETVEGRISIAERILKKASEYGIVSEDIIFDPLTMTVSTAADNALKTIESVREITRRLGCRTSLGVSNVSFGLPGREMLNSTFFNMALCNGLSAAIINPYSESMMNVYYSYCALTENDADFGQFIPYADKVSSVSVPENASNAADLSDAIFRGMKDNAEKICSSMLEHTDSLTLINEYIIPALDKTGAAFESGKMYLPQLLMSAEAASRAFGVIKNNSTQTSKSKCKIILATVKGDIHDIGKNIVKLLLDNYGFDVIDLGKDVAPQVIADAVIKEKAPMLGLSALMTTTLSAMEDTVKLVKKEVPDCVIFIGGAVVNKEFADDIGADAYTKDAMESVRFASAVYEKLK